MVYRTLPVLKVNISARLKDSKETCKKLEGASSFLKLSKRYSAANAAVGYPFVSVSDIFVHVDDERSINLYLVILACLNCSSVSVK